VRAFAFVLGVICGGPAILVLSWAYPGIWLPLALGGVVAALLLGFPVLARHPMTAPYVATFALTVIIVWIRSGPTTSRRSALAVSVLLLTLLVFALAWLALRFFLTRPEERRLAFPFAAMLLLACFVARLSGGAGGADPMLTWFQSALGLSDEAAYVAVLVVRKTIHFTFYGLFAWTALRAAWMVAGPPRAAAILALSLALTLALFDELRQASSPGRTGSLWDVALDMSGAGAFVGLASRRAQRKAVPGGSLQG
jgi:VanZ family protein